MNLFFYLRTFILNYSFIVILSDHNFFYFVLLKHNPFKTETGENGKRKYRNDRVPF